LNVKLRCQKVNSRNVTLLQSRFCTNMFSCCGMSWVISIVARAYDFSSASLKSEEKETGHGSQYGNWTARQTIADLGFDSEQM
jgi:hypothetical protein